ncbi:DNA internalization-related competence protein ComEC/Rec2 [Butyrivibrio sp. CB08]|uniref:DNA internalization-related competence protein ComEC/Rec2 n=1 Tax=Butyrivibrio sp. CB08 TaxID=2364879 RepID=UPI000EA8DA25|nr:DNA internalization-related competence protein ComEC/Rec2 [Butyrivibrio sp. CB08]RKM62258.1 DNA internalization-related competence protein ComEC/Rec2 [Butyrivibrio sp. CB08]
MKRPLAFLAILVTVAVFVYLNVFSSAFADTDSALDKSYVELFGKVHSKELKKSSTGETNSVIYLIPTGEENRDFEMVQCYIEPSCTTCPSIGQYVLVSGKARTFSRPTNPGEFDSHLYYSTLKISYRLSDAKILKIGGKKNWYRESLYQVRIFLEDVLDGVLPSEDAGVMKAMLLGDKAYLDEETKDMYKSSGIMHILAVSALHISIIGMGLYKLLRRLRLNSVVASLFAIVFMYSYGVMCGMGTSSFRAISMFVLRLLAPLVGRTYDLISGLSLAEILLLLDQPLYLYNSGFLFSFGAVVGIAVVKPSLRPMYLYLFGNRMKFADDKDRQPQMEIIKGAGLKVLDALQTGLSIALVTLPVYSLFYFTYPVHSLFLNLMVIPLMATLMLSGIVTMLLGVIAPVLGYLPGFLVHLILSFYKLISSVNEVNGSFTWYMGHSESSQVFVYMVLVLASLWMSKEKRAKKIVKEHVIKSPVIKDVCRFGVLLLAVIALTFHIPPELEIDMIDVGQGDGIVISSAGRSILIDGGSTSKKNVGKYQIIPFLKYKGIGKLEAAIVTHEDEDHISGLLEIMDDMEKGGIQVKKLLLPEVAESSRGDNYHLLESRAKELRIPILYINKGESFSLGKAQFTCLNPRLNMTTDGANAYSTVLFMRYGQFTALFTGDMEGEGLVNVKDQLRKNAVEISDGLDLLKVAHHGSEYTTDEEFLELTRPRIALISNGQNNKYGHPHKALIERLGAFGAQIYRTDQLGEISIIVKKSSLHIEGYRHTLYH